jgi:hypothetical protein
MVISIVGYLLDKYPVMRYTLTQWEENRGIRITLDHCLNFDHTREQEFSLRKKIDHETVIKHTVEGLTAQLWQIAIKVIPVEFRSSVRETYEIEDGYVIVYLKYKPLVKEK